MARVDRHPALDLIDPGGQVRGDLLVLPHAGGSPGQYRFLRDHVPATTRLAIARYPGREKRLGEPFAPSLGHLADEVATASTASGLRRPVILGHSMGGLLAVEVARQLLPDPDLSPPAVIISGRGPATTETGMQIHTRGDDELVDQIYALAATPVGLRDTPDARALFLPPVRDDYRLVETYVPTSTEPLPIPVQCFAGDDDPTVAVDEVAACAELTTERFDLTVFPGGHFFISETPVAVGAALSRVLAYYQELDPA